MEQRRRNSYRLRGHDYADSSYAYFVTLDVKIKQVAPGRQIDPSAPFTTCRALGQQANDSLLFYRTQGKLLIFAYCIMPTHAHILTSPQGGANLSTILGSYESYVARLSWEHGVIGILWQRSFYDHVLRGHDNAERIAAYIINNPVKAGLVTDWRDWPWCGMPDPL
jgi:REP element-mobilizing transposase RayT